MKNLILPIALAAILLTACSKEESVEQTELQTIDSVYVLNQINENNAFWDTIILEEGQRSANTEYLNNSIPTDSYTEGHYRELSRNGLTIIWAGSQNERGIFGNAELIQVSPNFSFHYILETECIMVDGNKAVYGGIITQVRNLSGNTPNIGVGWRFYFNVIDATGQIGHLANDQIANVSFFASPRSPSLCNVYLPNNPVWSTQGFSDVTEPGYVIVNN